jgi:hypothetical protein
MYEMHNTTYDTSIVASLIYLVQWDMVAPWCPGRPVFLVTYQRDLRGRGTIDDVGIEIQAPGSGHAGRIPGCDWACHHLLIGGI